MVTNQVESVTSRFIFQQENKMKIEEMTFEQFCEWSTGQIAIKIGQGESLKSIVWFILNVFAQQWQPAQKK
jgi:hypothetical protein